MGPQIRRFSVVFGVLVAVTVLSAGQRELREHSVVVSVLAGDAPVTDMKAGEFTVTEDGVTREVLRVAAAPPPSHLMILVDDSQVIQPLVQDLRTAVGGFLKTMGALTPVPQVALMTFGERPTQRADYAPNVTQAQRAAGRLFPASGGGAYFLEAVLEVAKDLKKRSAAHPVLVAFVDEGGPEFSNMIASQVSDQLRAINGSLWTITHQQGAPPIGDLPARERATVLGDVTTASGGMNVVVLSGQGLTPAFERTAAALTTRYLVTYGRPDSLVPPDRLQVASTRPGVRVHAPRWSGK